MSFLDIVKNNLTKTDFNLKRELDRCSPSTSGLDYGRVPMEFFNKLKCMDAILVNLARQPVQISKGVLDMLLDYFSNDFSSLTRKTGLQILLLFSKTDIPRAYEARYPGQSRLYTMDDFFELKFRLFLSKLTKLKENLVSEASAEDVNLIKAGLRRSCMINALQLAIEKCGKKIEENVIREKIDSMRIYQMKSFLPIPELRGATLVDGFVFCTSQIAFYDTDELLKEADIITLGLHETSQFINRCLESDFNFLTPPFEKYNGGNQNPCLKYDTEIRDREMELGREAELIVFGGHQPDWLESDVKVAAFFRDRLKTVSIAPVINEKEYPSIGLQRREGDKISCASGIDMIERGVME